MSGLENDVLVAKNVNFDFTSNPPHNGIVTADGQLLIGSTANPNVAMVANTLTAGTGITITNAPGSITVASTASLTDLHLPRFIVASSTNGTGANFTSITSAIAAAQGTGINSTIALQPGTYTEDFTWPAGINIVAFKSDSLTPNVTIVGNITCSSAGTRSMSGIRLQTNGAAFLTVSGNAATVVNLNDCYLNCTNATGISFTSSSSSAQINLNNCQGNLGTTGIGLFASSSAGSLSFISSIFTNTGSSTTANTISAGLLSIQYSEIDNPITTSGTAAYSVWHSIFNCNGLNTTALTSGGSGIHSTRFSHYLSGTASAISVSNTLAIRNCQIASTNTNAITGNGTIAYATLTFSDSSSTINSTLTLSPYVFNPAILRSSSQPAFLAQAESQTDVTGAGAAYTVTFGTEIFDQNSNFSSPTFTAPYTGRYTLGVGWNLLELSAAMTIGTYDIVTSNRTYRMTINSGAIRSSANSHILYQTVLADMDAADIATAVVTISNGAGNTADIGTNAYFYGSLTC